MSTGAKIGLFFLSMFILTIFKQFLPFNITYIGAFIIFILYHTSNTDKEKSSEKEVKTENDVKVKEKYINEDWESKIQSDIKTDTPQETNQITEDKHTDQAEILIEKLINEPSLIENELKNTDQSLFEKKTISLFANLQTPQKVIFSVSSIALLFVLFYAYAQSVDYRLRIKETWYVWIIFIILQTWLQNKFWSSGITLRIPNWSLLKIFWVNNKRKILFALGFLSVILLLFLSIEPINSYLEERTIEQNNHLKDLIAKEKQDSVNRENASIINEMSKFSEYRNTTLTTTTKSEYKLEVRLIEIDDLNQKFKIKITAKRDASLLDQYPEIHFGETFSDAESRLKKSLHSFATDFNLNFHTKKFGVIKYHIDSRIMRYEGDYKDVVIYNGDTISGKSSQDFLNYHQFSGEQYIDIGGKKEAFLSIDSISADTISRYP